LGETAGADLVLLPIGAEKTARPWRRAAICISRSGAVNVAGGRVVPKEILSRLEQSLSDRVEEARA